MQDERTPKQIGDDIYREGVADGESSERSALVSWLRADDKGRGLVAYRHCWNIAAMIERGEHLEASHEPPR